jgi:hypothetical protein
MVWWRVKMMNQLECLVAELFFGREVFLRCQIFLCAVWNNVIISEIIVVNVVLCRWKPYCLLALQCVRVTALFLRTLLWLSSCFVAYVCMYVCIYLFIQIALGWIFFFIYLFFFMSWVATTTILASWPHISDLLCNTFCLSICGVTWSYRDWPRCLELVVSC